MYNKDHKPEGDSFLGYIITEVIVGSVFRFFGWVITGIVGLFTGD